MVSIRPRKWHLFRGGTQSESGKGEKEKLGDAFPKSEEDSVPIDSQDGLHLLRPLIDGLIPRQAALLAEGGHRLN
jgi:hypothetical protein